MVLGVPILKHFRVAKLALQFVSSTTATTTAVVAAACVHNKIFT